VTLTVTDGAWHSSTSDTWVEVVVGQLPFVTPLVNVTGDPGQTLSFSADAWDPDVSDTLSYTWNFGDGSALAVGNPATHAYAAAGKYTFSVSVSDRQGHNVTSSATASIAFVLNLAQGWNMVTVPLVGYGYNASTLGLLQGDVVAGWNGMIYNQSFTVLRSPARYDFAIEESTGYWIYSGVAKTIRLYGSVPTTTQTKVVTVTAGGGWALIGFESLNTTRNASWIKTMYSGGVITTVAAYNTTSGRYDVYTGYYRTDFVLVPGQGYWVYCTASGTLSYSP